MKKTIACILLAASCVLVGCGSDENVISGDVNNVVTNNGQEDGAEGNAGQQEQGNQDAATHKGYVFESKDVAIEIDAEAAAYISALGEALSYYEAPSCAFGDLDKMYTYSGFELDTYSLEGVDYVSAVILLDDSVSTPEGLCIGDSVDKIEQAYGAPTSSENNMMVYVKDHMKLCFLTRDDAIIAIEYRTRVLD